MKLAGLEALDSFALLGPGFSEGPCLLLTHLRPADAGEAVLVHASYEARGDAARLYAARAQPCELELEEGRAPEISLEEGGYAGAIDRIRAEIAAGDVYQVNFALRARLGNVSGSELANQLCRRGLPRFFAWVRFPDGGEFISASPERLFSIDGAQIRCEPMKGTAALDRELFLSSSEKDRAELFMITDLVRNDLIPICVPGSVRVACERRFIRLPYLLQAVSDLEGQLRPGVGPLEALAALHPGGSVTGAPKRMAMRSIAALEPEPRGAYCGSLGLLQAGRARFSILIRTAEKRGSSWVYGVGGGVTWQSNAEDELREIHLKLGALR